MSTQIMNNVTSKLSSALDKLMVNGGNKISVKYYLVSPGSVYDEEVILSQSGNTIWTSGLVFPIDSSSDDSILLEQGKIAMGDSKIYVNGSLVFGNITGSIAECKIGLGSPSNVFYSLIPNGTNIWSNEDIGIYKKGYIRVIQGGSFYGES